LPGSEFSDEQFAFHLQADDEKEHRHESIVDPEVERFCVRSAGEAESEGDMPEMKITRGPGRIGPEEGDNNAADEKQAARTLEGGELAEWPNETIDRSRFCFGRFLHQKAKTSSGMGPSSDIMSGATNRKMSSDTSLRTRRDVR
jgi:hypothetical protein